MFFEVIRCSRLYVYIVAICCTQTLFADGGNSGRRTSVEEEHDHPRILAYADTHRDFIKMARMFEQAHRLGVDKILGGGDITNGRNLLEIEKTYKFAAQNLQWLRTPPYNQNSDTYQRSEDWIEIPGNKEEYGFLRINRKKFGAAARKIIGEVARVPSIEPDEGYPFNFNGFRIFASHMPMSPVPKELLGDGSLINFRNIIWPPNWPLPFLSGPEASTASSMKKNVEHFSVDLVLYFHLHVSGYYKDKKTGVLFVSPGSASKNNVPDDQKTATFIIIDTNTREVTWHDIDNGGKVYRTLKLDSPKITQCETLIQRVVKPPQSDATAAK